MPKRDTLSAIEADFQKQKASGSWQVWALHSETPFEEPPWRSIACKLALARAASGKGTVEEQARQIFDSELVGPETDLHACRQRARYEARGDKAGLEFSRIQERFNPPHSQLRNEFVQYVQQRVVQPTKKKGFVDPEHRHCVKLLNKILKVKEQTLGSWIKELGIPRSQVFDYRAGRIRGSLSLATRTEIEDAIRQSAKNLGL